MNLSVKADYALHAILDLAMQSRSGPVRIADIAKRQRIPQKFLELILATLKQGGFVESRRGAEGGYLLARPANAITVGEVMRFIEGGRNKAGGRKKSTENPFADLWNRVDASVSSVVDETTFADLMRAWQEKQAKYIPNWDI